LLSAAGQIITISEDKLQRATQNIMNGFNL